VIAGSAPPPVLAVLTIAGSDSSAGAGAQADLKTFAANGVYGTSVVTAITAQNTSAVEALEPLAADLVTAQIEAVASDFTLHAVKTGMLATAAIVEAVAAAVTELDLPSLVVDPVLASTSGSLLLDADGVQAMIWELFPRARVITPNLYEAEALSGCRIRSLAEGRDAAKRLHDLGPSVVIVTGGHLPGDDIVDLLFDGRDFVELKTPRVGERPTHGTGCAFAAAIAANLAMGSAPVEAAARAQSYVGGAVRHAISLGRGLALLHHLWNTGRPARADGIA
jgi:hydroxymethylpyrimidine/phosphomethylpyrimidine kinase